MNTTAEFCDGRSDSETRLTGKLIGFAGGGDGLPQPICVDDEGWVHYPLWNTVRLIETPHCDK